MFINAVIEKFNKNQKYIFYSLIILIILIGIFLRTGLYLREIPFWGDEAFLCAALADRNIFDTFSTLDFAQKAPPLFCSLVLIVTKIFGFNILSLRFIPFISSILILPFSFKLLKQNLRNPFAIFLGMLFFSLNPMLIYYSAEFKPYSSDVLIFIILLVLYSNFNENKSLKNFFNKHFILSTVLFSLLSVLILLFSFSSIFVIPAVIIVDCINEKKLTLTHICILICLILTGLYLWKSDLNVYNYMYDFWIDYSDENYFLSFSSGNFITRLQDYLYYILGSLNKFFQIIIILFVFGGTVLYIKEKNNNIFVIILTLIFLCTASLLNLYPVVERLVLFYFPAVILMLLKPLDMIYIPIFSNRKAIKISILMLLFFPLFYIVYIYSDILINNDVYYDLYNFLAVERRKGLKEIVDYIILHSNKNVIVFDENYMNAFIQSYKKISGTSLGLKVILKTEEYIKITDETFKYSDMWIVISKEKKEDIIKNDKNKFDIKLEKEFPVDVYLYKISLKTQTKASKSGSSSIIQ